MTNRNNTITKNEIAIAAKILKKLQPGILPLDLFNEITRLWVTSTVELVPLRYGDDDQIEILMLKRPKKDPNWPNMLHTPGTVLRATDVNNGIDNAINRIFFDEIGVKSLSKPIFLKTIFHKINRGVEFSSIYYVNMGSAQPPNGIWYSENNLPNNLINTQLDFIKIAVNEFRNNKPRTAHKPLVI